MGAKWLSLLIATLSYLISYTPWRSTMYSILAEVLCRLGSLAAFCFGVRRGMRVMGGDIFLRCMLDLQPFFLLVLYYFLRYTWLWL